MKLVHIHTFLTVCFLFNFRISPEQPQVGGIEQFADTTNTMMSHVPMDHRIIQIQNNGSNHHHSNNNNNQNFNSIITNFHNNNNTTTSSSCGSNSMTAFTTNNNNSLNSSQQSLMSSKLLVLHPEQMNDTYPEGECVCLCVSVRRLLTLFLHFFTVNDGGGNIVLLATEQMEISNADHDVINNNILNNVNSNGGGGNIITVSTDEELTPLTWLHDKNLLKGIIYIHAYIHISNNLV
jgi:hypothetical protein